MFIRGEGDTVARWRHGAGEVPGGLPRCIIIGQASGILPQQMSQALSLIHI